MQWQDRRLLDLFGIEHPILQAPMAGVTSPQMAIATSEAGALGSIAGAMLTLDGLRQEFQMVKQGTSRRGLAPEAGRLLWRTGRCP